MTDFPGFLPPSGLPINEMVNFAKTIPSVDPNVVREQIIKSDTNGDKFVSTDELRKGDLIDVEQAWGRHAGKKHLETLNRELNKPETLKSAKVTNFLDAKTINSPNLRENIDIIQGTVNLGGTDYEFDLANRKELTLKLRDDKDNLYILTNDDIPPAFLKDLISKRPPNNPQPVVRYSSIFNSRFCSV